MLFSWIYGVQEENMWYRKKYPTKCIITRCVNLTHHWPQPFLNLANFFFDSANEWAEKALFPKAPT